MTGWNGTAEKARQTRLRNIAEAAIDDTLKDTLKKPLTYLIGLVPLAVGTAASLISKHWAWFLVALGAYILALGTLLGVVLIAGRRQIPTAPLDQPLARRTPEPATDILADLWSRTDWPFVLVGSIYLDLMIGNVPWSDLRDEEWSTLDSIRTMLGGSIILAGRSIYSRHRESPVLFSIVSADQSDPLAKLTAALVAKEEWIAEGQIFELPHSGAAVTVQLHNSRDGITTMLTHRGPLPSFSWRLLERPLEEALRNGGVLYIGGFLKTGLWANLAYHLQQLHGTLVCIDHGSIPREGEFQEATEALRLAFREGLVHVYFCTYGEFCALTGLRSSEGTPQHRDLARAWQNSVPAQKLPPITVVRGKDLPEHVGAYLICNGTLETLDGPESHVNRRHVWTSSFNGHFLSQLSELRDLDPLSAVRLATRKALDLSLQPPSDRISSSKDHSDVIT